MLWLFLEKRKLRGQSRRTKNWRFDLPTHKPHRMGLPICARCLTLYCNCINWPLLLHCTAERDTPPKLAPIVISIPGTNRLKSNDWFLVPIYHFDYARCSVRRKRIRPSAGSIDIMRPCREDVGPWRKDVGCVHILPIIERFLPVTSSLTSSFKTDSISTLNRCGNGSSHNRYVARPQKVQCSVTLQKKTFSRAKLGVTKTTFLKLPTTADLNDFLYYISRSETFF